MIVILVSACNNSAITDFEDLNLKELDGQTIIIKGTAAADKKAVLYGVYFLLDSNGFKIPFEPRGNRVINLGETYTIKGVVYNNRGYTMSGNEFYLLKEIKP